jgi:hypothetical protein
MRTTAGVPHGTALLFILTICYLTCALGQDGVSAPLVNDSAPWLPGEQQQQQQQQQPGRRLLQASFANWTSLAFNWQPGQTFTAGSHLIASVNVYFLDAFNTSSGSLGAGVHSVCTIRWGAAASLTSPADMPIMCWCRWQ